MPDTLYPTYTSPRTLAQIKTRADWQGLDPEFAHRVESLMLFGGGALGFGGGSRTTAGQTALFLSRYHEDPNGAISWNGKRWTKNPGVASAAPPGNSYHEPTTPDGLALAADLTGDLSILHDSGNLFGLIEFENVNNEPWHTQPMEIPHARREYNAATMHPLEQWSTSGNPPVPPVEGDDDMAEKIQVPGDAAIFVRSGLTATWANDTAVTTEWETQGLIQPAGQSRAVSRTFLKLLELRGPLPNNNVTKAADFAKWTP